MKKKKGNGTYNRLKKCRSFYFDWLFVKGGCKL